MKQLFKTTESVIVNECSQDSKYSGINRIFLSFKDITFPNQDKDGTINQNATSFGVSFDNLFEHIESNNFVVSIMKRSRMKRALTPECAGLVFTDAKIEFIVSVSDKDGETFRNKPISKGTVITDIIKVEPQLDKDLSNYLMSVRDSWFIDKSTATTNDTNIYANI